MKYKDQQCMTRALHYRIKLGAIHKGRPKIFANFSPPFSPLVHMCPNFQTPPSPRPLQSWVILAKFQLDMMAVVFLPHLILKMSVV